MFYNTLTHRVEAFEPLRPPQVTMYNCGPTVYDYAHIGNFKTFLFADVLRRTLELLGHEVHQVMNLTDVGHMTEDQLADGGGADKMQVAADRLRASKKAGNAHALAIDDPSDPYQVAEFYVQAFLGDSRALRLKVADEYPRNMPRATDHVDAMLALIQTLVDRGHAYVAHDSAVYFHVESFPDYGTLSGNRLDQLKGGAGGRVLAQNQAGKRHPADFLLWKPDATHLMRWPSAFGEGYPGWHIECSAMAKAALGHDTIDLHTGGEDNIFPHHECEIAQSCAATGQPHFARLWMHTRHLFVEGEKMSKSRGNFFTVRQVLEGALTGSPVHPAVLRFELIKAKYRSTMDVSAKSLRDSASAVRKLRDYHASLNVPAGTVPPISLDHPAVHRFAACLADDLNVAGALAVVFEFIAEPVTDPAQAAGVLAQFDQVLAVLHDDTQANLTPDSDASSVDGDALAAALDAARAAKDFNTADALRQQLIDAGYEVSTTKDGTVARLPLA